MVKFVNHEVLLVFLGVLVQVPLAIFLGHYYDQRSFLDTGYLVSAGLNPYQSHLITVFTSNSALMGPNPIIGYPPPWPMLLGLIYRLSFNITPNLLLYNFATKIPIIAANIGLAYVTAAVMQRTGASNQKVRAAWLFLLFNPFTLLTTAAWGEYDTLIALLCVASLYFLSKCMVGKSSILLSLSLVLKPISLPLIGLPLLCSQTGKVKKFIITLSVAFLMLFALWFLPFYLFGWIVPSAGFQFTAYFRMAGGLSVFNVFELLTNTAAIPASLWFLGYIWIPALIVGYYFIYRNPPKSTVEVVRAAAVLMLIFFLTRSWLSEPNLNLLFPLILIAFSFDKISSRLLHLAWIVPLAFMFFNWSIPQLLFLIYPQIMTNITTFDDQFGTARFLARFAVTILWYILAIKILFAVFPKNRSA